MTIILNLNNLTWSNCEKNFLVEFQQARTLRLIIFDINSQKTRFDAKNG